MSRIFLSHSSVDEREAVALKQWLADNGWDDVFLDVDAERGLIAGERWQEALKRAADRCEAVVFVVSPAWAKSKWCLAEFLLAKSLNKRIFGVVIKSVAFGELPTEMTAEWQLCHLVGLGATETIACLHREQPVEVAFLAEGLGRLKAGLQNAGLRADFFPWPPKEDPERAPYRGLEPLDAADAAVFFGRDLEILEGLDKLRGMRALGAETLFVILGASGAGKSSFLRAGLLPRLARDDRHFLPLLPIRPERSPLFGERGLAHVIHEANGRLNLQPTTLGSVKDALGQGAESFLPLLRNIQSAARARLVGLPDDAPPPTLVLSIDQAEELFNADSRVNSREGDETHAFLELIGMVLRTSLTEDRAGKRAPMIVMFTIRSDRYEPLQTAPELTELKSLVFDALKPMPRAQFKEVICGPALRATASGRSLAMPPELVNRLLSDCDQQGGDTLPLLGLTLARLYRELGSDGDLSLDEYERMGGMAEVIKDEAESVLSPDPATRQTQLEQLHDAFIPALVTINPDSEQPMRRVAKLPDLPADSRPLVQALVDKHLLLSDLRGGQPVIEVAHESLFRQWDVLVDWLREERTDLLEVDRLEQAVSAWINNDRKAPWLMGGERLDRAEALAAKQRYSRRLEGSREFLLASRQWERKQREEEDQLRNEKLDAETAARREAEKRQQEAQLAARKLWAAVVGVAFLFIITVVFLGSTFYHWKKAQIALTQAHASRLVSGSIAMVYNMNSGGAERGVLQLVAAEKIAPRVSVEGALLASNLIRSGVRKLWSTDEGITSLHFSPDGSRLVSGGSDGMLRLWDAQSGQPIGEPLQGYDDSVRSVAFSPDGNRIVSGSADGTLRRWDAQSGQPIGEPLQGHSRVVRSVAFSPDGSRIVSGSADGTLRRWDAQSGQPIGEPLQGHTGIVSSVAFSPDGSRIVSGSTDHTLWLWDAQSGRQIRELKGHDDSVRSVAFSPDGSRIVSGGADRTLRRWDAQSGRPIGEPLRGHTGIVSSVAFSPDGSRIVSGSADHTLWLWDAQSGQPIGEPLQGHTESVSSIALSPDGSLLASGGHDGLWLWNAQRSQSMDKLLQGHTTSVRSVAFSPDGSRLVSGGRDGMLRLWDAKSGGPVGEPLRGHSGIVSSVAFSPDGSRIVSGGADRTLRLWDAQSGQPIGGPWLGHSTIVRSVAFSPDGSLIVSGSGDRTVRLWVAQSGRQIRELRGHGGSVRSVAFSPDGSRIVSGSADHTLRLWDAQSGQQIRELRGHGGSVRSVAFSPDGSRIVSGSADRTLQLWDAQSGLPVGKPLRGHNDGVSSVAFSLDGDRLISGDFGGVLQLWDAKRGQPIGVPLQGDAKSVWSVAFSPDGIHIVSGGEDRKLHIRYAPKFELNLVCAKLTRNMSRQEWRDWVSPEIDYECQCPGLPIPPDDPASGAEPEMCPPADA